MIQERLKQFIDYKGISKYKFYKETGLSNGFLDKRGTIGVDKCEIIYSIYPEINFEWLVTGHGEMLKSKIKTSTNYIKSDIPFSHDNIDDDRDYIIEIQKKLIEKLEKELLQKKLT